MSRQPRKQSLNFETVGAHAAGRWLEILVALGIDASFLKDKKGPCPGCGGKDRFRYDDKGGAKTFYCNAHGNGDGFDLLCHVHGWNKAEALSRVAGELGMSPEKPLSAEELAANKARVEALKAQAERDEIDRERRAIERAKDIWERSEPATDAHPYLVSKGVKAHGLRVATYCKGYAENGVWRPCNIENTLLIPIRNANGDLKAVQAIFPEMVILPGETQERNKEYVGPTAGGFYLLGTPENRVFVCEGYATGASVFKATGTAVAIAFDAGNLGKVAHEVARKYPGARVVVAADDDQWTDGNPGLTKGQTAAAAVGGVMVKPVFVNLAGKPTDFNDLAQRESLQRVQSVILDQLANAEKAAKRALLKPTNVVRLAPKSDTPPPSKARGSRKNASHATQYYFNEADGLYYHPPEFEKPIRLGAPLRAICRTRDKESGDWGVMFEFHNPDGILTEVDIPATALLADGPEAIKQLVNAGYMLAPGAAARREFVNYIGGSSPEGRAIRVQKLGWHGDVFLMPGRCIGNPDERLLYQNARHCQNTAATAGTLDDWRDNVAARCRGNNRLLFAVSVAFAGPLLNFLGYESGGFHLYGAGSSGKTTTLLTASSVWGGPDFMKSWRNTDNALEGTASDHSDMLLPLDEIHQASKEKIGEAVYMLGNSKGKRRANDPNVKNWRLLFLSCGERTLANHLGEVGLKLTAGMDARMPCIPTDGGTGLGSFNNLHGSPTPGEFSDAIKAAAAKHYGSAGPQFIEELIKGGGLNSEDADHITKLAKTMAGQSSGQVLRVAQRFALVGFAGELATAHGLTGWAIGEARNAAEACFKAYLTERGGKGDLEDQDMARQVSLFFQVHGNCRFKEWDRESDTHSPSTVNRAGWKRKEPNDEILFYIFNEVFNSEVCKGFQPKKVQAMLKEKGALVLNKDGRAPKLCYPGNAALVKDRKCVVVTSKVLSLTGDIGGDDEAGEQES